MSACLSHHSVLVPDDDDQEGTLQGDREELSYAEVARRFLQRCIFLLLAVRPPLLGNCCFCCGLSIPSMHSSVKVTTACWSAVQPVLVSKRALLA